MTCKVGLGGEQCGEKTAVQGAEERPPVQHVTSGWPHHRGRKGRSGGGQWTRLYTSATPSDYVLRFLAEASPRHDHWVVESERHTRETSSSGGREGQSSDLSEAPADQTVTTDQKEGDRLERARHLDLVLWRQLELVCCRENCCGLAGRGFQAQLVQDRGRSTLRFLPELGSPPHVDAKRKWVGWAGLAVAPIISGIAPAAGDVMPDGMDGRWWPQRDSNPCFSLERAVS